MLVDEYAVSEGNLTWILCVPTDTRLFDLSLPERTPTFDQFGLLRRGVNVLPGMAYLGINAREVVQAIGQVGYSLHAIRFTTTLVDSTGRQSV